MDLSKSFLKNQKSLGSHATKVDKVQTNTLLTFPELMRFDEYMVNCHYEIDCISSSLLRFV